MTQEELGTEFTERCFGLLPPHKINKKEHVMPLLFAEVNSHLGEAKLKPARVFCDSGTLASIISKTIVSKLKIKKSQPVCWQTKAGVFEMNEQVSIQFQLPKLSKSKVIEWKIHVDWADKLSKNHEMIIGMDLMQKLGFTLDFNENKIMWDNATAVIKIQDYFHDDDNFLETLHEEFF